MRPPETILLEPRTRFASLLQYDGPCGSRPALAHVWGGEWYRGAGVHHERRALVLAWGGVDVWQGHEVVRRALIRADGPRLPDLGWIVRSILAGDGGRDLLAGWLEPIGKLRTFQEPPYTAEPAKSDRSTEIG